MANYQATKSNFLNWYLSSDEDEYNLARELIYMLREDGKIELKIEDLKSWVIYIPEDICVGYENKSYDRMVELNPNDVTLID